MASEKKIDYATIYKTVHGMLLEKRGREGLEAVEHYLVEAVGEDGLSRLAVILHTKEQTNTVVFKMLDAIAYHNERIAASESIACLPR